MKTTIRDLAHAGQSLYKRPWERRAAIYAVYPTSLWELEFAFRLRFDFVSLFLPALSTPKAVARLDKRNAFETRATCKRNANTNPNLMRPCQEHMSDETNAFLQSFLVKKKKGARCAAGIVNDSPAFRHLFVEHQQQTTSTVSATISTIGVAWFRPDLRLLWP
jgi:hypothetical protein